ASPIELESEVHNSNGFTGCCWYVILVVYLRLVTHLPFIRYSVFQIDIWERVVKI
ncbi:hypothetical protein BT63DRAFT_436528, partial [Microthyrium microscopicum]